MHTVDVLMPLEPLPIKYDKRIELVDGHAVQVLCKRLHPTLVNNALDKYRKFPLIDPLDAGIKAVFEYNCEEKPQIIDDAYRIVLQSIREELKVDDPLVPLTMSAACTHPDLKKKASPGLPFILQGYSTIIDCINNNDFMHEIGMKFCEIENDIHLDFPDSILIVKSVITTSDNQALTDTMIYPLLVHLLEAQFYFPLAEHLLTGNQSFLAYDLGVAKHGMAHVNQILYRNLGKVFLNTEISRLEKAAPKWLIYDAFDILKELYDFSGSTDHTEKLWNSVRFKVERRWKRIVNYFVNTRMRLHNGERFMKRNGIATGSLFAKVIGSIINAIVTRYCLYAITNKLPVEDLYLSGNGIIVHDEAVDIATLINLMNNYFGLALIPNKTHATQDPNSITYQGYLNRYGNPYRELSDFIADAIYTEAPYDSPFQTAVNLVAVAYTCFNPAYAHRFILSAQDLLRKIQVDRHQVVMEIRNNEHEYKFLEEIGVDVKRILFAPVGEFELVRYTVPIPLTRIVTRNVNLPDEKLLANWRRNSIFLTNTYRYEYFGPERMRFC